MNDVVHIFKEVQKIQEFTLGNMTLAEEIAVRKAPIAKSMY